MLILSTYQLKNVYTVFRVIYDHHFLIHQSYNEVYREKIDISISMTVIF